MNDDNLPKTVASVTPIRPDDSQAKAYILRLLSFRFTDMEMYLQTIDATCAALDRQFSARSYSVNDNEVEYDVDSCVFLEQTLPDLHAKSVFILTHSAFEEALEQLCYYASHPTNISIKDIHGSGIQRARRFLEKICSVTQPFNTKEWKQVEFFADVRNCIAHSTFVTSGRADKLLEKSGAFQGITIQKVHNHSSITLTKDFASFANETYQSMLKQVLDDIVL